MSNDWIVETIIAMRGPHPDTCDFCGKPYTEERFATPEEAGQWACIECVERWEAEDKAALLKDKP